MAMTGTFTATGQYSSIWYGGRNGFSVGITIGGGSNSIKLEQEIGGTWYTKGTAITATGMVYLAPQQDYVPGSRFRINGGTFDTGPISYQIDGDILGDASSAESGGSAPDSMLTEAGDPMQLENGDFILLEAA